MCVRLCVCVALCLCVSVCVITISLRCVWIFCECDCMYTCVSLCDCLWTPWERPWKDNGAGDAWEFGLMCS